MKSVVVTGLSAGLEEEQSRSLFAARTRHAAVTGKFFNATPPSMLPSRVVDRIIGRRLSLLPTLR